MPFKRKGENIFHIYFWKYSVPLKHSISVHNYLIGSAECQCCFPLLYTINLIYKYILSVIYFSLALKCPVVSHSLDRVMLYWCLILTMELHCKSQAVKFSRIIFIKPEADRKRATHLFSQHAQGASGAKKEEDEGPEQGGGGSSVGSCRDTGGCCISHIFESRR